MDRLSYDVANAIARTWVERLQRDAMAWTLPGPSSRTSNIGNTTILSAIQTTGGTWFLPTQGMGAAIELMSPGFDILGRDLAKGSLGSADFCVNLRLTWLSPANAQQDLIRADVRVLWPMGINNSLQGFCSPTSAVPTDADPNTDKAALRWATSDPNQPVFHTLYLTTTIRENAAP
jgi:hypothetical protein